MATVVTVQLSEVKDFIRIFYHWRVSPTGLCDY